MDEEHRLKAERRMNTVDAMPPGLRACVHDFGMTVVQQFLQAGITNHHVIRQLVRTVHRGSREIGDRSEAPRVRGSRNADLIDEFMAQRGLPMVGGDLISFLRDNNRFVVPKEPSRNMVAASMASLSSRLLGEKHGNPVTREFKHRLRLRDALEEADFLDDQFRREVRASEVGPRPGDMKV